MSDSFIEYTRKHLPQTHKLLAKLEDIIKTKAKTVRTELARTTQTSLAELVPTYHTGDNHLKNKDGGARGLMLIASNQDQLFPIFSVTVAATETRYELTLTECATSKSLATVSGVWERPTSLPKFFATLTAEVEKWAAPAETAPAAA